jgi:hypothetical protein
LKKLYAIGNRFKCSSQLDINAIARYFKVDLAAFKGLIGCFGHNKSLIIAVYGSDFNE